MLTGLFTILLMAGCLHGTSALPTRASSYNSAFSQRSRRPAPNEPLDDLTLSSVGMDQSAEASSNVDDIVPHSRNQLDYGKRDNYGYKDYYKYPENEYPQLPTRATINLEQDKDCPDCEIFRQRIVTLGESRSYSIVSNPQPPNSPAQTYTEVEVLSTDQNPPTTTWQATQFDETTTEVTTEATDDIEEKIISVRVSSSVGKSVQQEPAALLTEEKPFATAVQRSHFSVEEAVHESISSEEEKMRNVFDSSKLVTSLGIFTTENPPVVTSSVTLGRYPTPSNDRADRSLYSRNSNLKDPRMQNDGGIVDSLAEQSLKTPQTVVVSENTSPPVNPLSSPVNYHTSLQSATSGSSISFYRDPPNLRRLSSTSPTTTSTLQPSLVEPFTPRLKHETRVETVSYHEEVVLPQRTKDKIENQTVNEQKSYQFTNVHDQSFHHVQVTHLNEKKRPPTYAAGRNYQQSEKVYGMPEQNYEVDESISLKTNGRTHGVQGGPTTRPDSNKFGYVVEGRDYKKYRVEERTADGFIVGEYGVVRHDDGSLRGVRYTADSTINPKVIYEALVKFLSL